MIKPQLVLTVFCLLGLLACKEADNIKPVIDPLFSSYFNKFLEEGQKRGKTFSEEEKAISIKLSNYPRTLGNYAGYATQETRTIDIDSVWLHFSDSQKEKLLFHELGHLMLKRVHSFHRLPNGEYSSLMATTDNNVDKCSVPINIGNLRKKYYLDELFDINTSTPSWSSEKIEWKEPNQSEQSVVIGVNAWNSNATLESLVKGSSNAVSYKILPSGMNLEIGKTETVNSEFKLPLTTLFPKLAETPLQNYEVHLRYKLYGRGFELGWRPNNIPENSYALISNNCNGDNNYLGISDNRGGFFVNYKKLQDIQDKNDLVLRCKDNFIIIWLNGHLIFQTDIVAGTAASPISMNLYFGLNKYDFEFITITRL
ncbi:hypothetical protein EGI26_16910 [Lacihabitans sp. CCS-44]|uniref:hypothetical protein n=1 Tax=Lacihabitans sp. CCS-44 TaxID=2487331 RepID=UPI0020CCC904|nr:hypothetical protein [Lacihabitans sp. CCS-44]MCP9756848.1 hypothetical protein [Lacihabitans sp. CCS-44]